MKYVILAPTDHGIWMFLSNWRDNKPEWNDDPEEALLFATKSEAKNITKKLGFGIDVMH